MLDEVHAHCEFRCEPIYDLLDPPVLMLMMTSGEVYCQTTRHASSEVNFAHHETVMLAAPHRRAAKRVKERRLQVGVARS